MRQHGQGGPPGSGGSRAHQAAGADEASWEGVRGREGCKQAQAKAHLAALPSSLRVWVWLQATEELWGGAGLARTALPRCLRVA
eukprot:6708345-Prymnesium_polylepis.1